MSAANTSEKTVREAWVAIPSEAEVRAQMPSGRVYPYDFGFLPAMGRLLRAHNRIGPTFLTLFGQIMWAPEGYLSRREREMIAAVAAAAQDCHY
ncbi:MAG TPA: carboxymuconolactone decarboxylase family protein [Candidatus Binatia bacterium]|nr:carboxymuconolactone decarboxylase family protein [Candidatus Binatia bacterium]